MTTCSESGQVRKEAAIRSLCRASESIERTGFLFARFYQTAQCSTLRATQGEQFVIQKARHDQKVYALPFSCQLVRPGCRSLAAPRHQWLRGSRDGGITICFYK